ncbi:hypothetical protein ECDEC8E_1099 [Escherichia coli DEC8E]|nr:hypothetical protein ECDEC8E_1099 [Escherichia coli DEC8E]
MVKPPGRRAGVTGELVDASGIFRKLLVDESLFSRKFPD